MWFPARTQVSEIVPLKLGSNKKNFILRPSATTSGRSCGVIFVSSRGPPTPDPHDPGATPPWLQTPTYHVMGGTRDGGALGLYADEACLFSAATPSHSAWTCGESVQIRPRTSSHVSRLVNQLQGVHEDETNEVLLELIATRLQTPWRQSVRNKTCMLNLVLCIIVSRREGKFFIGYLRQFVTFVLFQICRRPTITQPTRIQNQNAGPPCTTTQEPLPLAHPENTCTWR